MGHSRGSTPPTRVRRPAGSSPRAEYPPLHPAGEAAPIPWPTAVSPGWRAAPAISVSELCTLSLARPDATVPRKIPDVVIGGLIAPSNGRTIRTSGPAAGSRYQIWDAPYRATGSNGMRIERRFTRDGHDAYAGIAFRTAASEIRNPDGSTVFKARSEEHTPELQSLMRNPYAV